MRSISVTLTGRGADGAAAGVAALAVRGTLAVLGALGGARAERQAGRTQTRLLHRHL